MQTKLSCTYHTSYTAEERKGKEGKNKAETMAD
jgi:hypothetical protein